MSLPAWGEWIEMCISDMLIITTTTSLPAWGEWIEIWLAQSTLTIYGVSPRMGRVD